MKMFQIMASALVAFAGVNAAAETGLFLEPGITYTETSGNLDYPSTNGSGHSASISGLGVVVKGGVHIAEQFFVAADARYAMNRYNDNSSAYNVDATSYDIAPVIGYQMPNIGVRLFAGYVLTGNLDPKSASNGADFKLSDAAGWRIGAGLKVQMVSVNIEWQQLRYQTTKWSGASSGNSGDIRYNPSGLVASVTFPLEFN